MYGNKTVVNNTDGSYKVNYGGSPVYIKATDKLGSGEVVVKNTASSWDVDDSEKINVNVKLPFDAKIGDSAVILIASYDEKGRLTCAKQESAIYNSGVINVSFSADGMGQSDSVKIFVFDSFNRIRPILKTKLLPEFGDDINIEYSEEGNMVTLKGKLKLHTPYHNMTVTAWRESISKEELINNYADALLYQDMIMSDAHSNFEISFKIHENFSEAVRVQISGKV